MIYHISDVILFADGTGVLETDDNYSNFTQIANFALPYLIKCFQANQLPYLCESSAPSNLMHTQVLDF